MAKEENDLDAIVSAPFGFLGLQVSEQGLKGISLLPGKYKTFGTESGLAARIEDQLRKYFVNSRIDFDIPLNESGTPFQQTVWQLLRKIPVGRTVYYRDLARQLNTSPRAIGAACRSNPIPIITPCHRVVAMDGMGGFMGKTTGGPIQMKEWLLRHEHRL